MFLPLHQVADSAVVIHKNSLPAEIVSGFLTAELTGVMREDPAVTPSCPYLLLPQHWIFTDVDMMQLKASPEVTLVARILGTLVGRNRGVLNRSPN